MEIIDFEGKTRTLGEAQGFQPLHIKDAVLRDENGNIFPVMMSVWRPSEEELMTLMHNGYICLQIVGTAHPPVMLHVLRDE